MSKLVVMTDPVKGRGVYANGPIQKGELIEICEIILVEYEHAEDNVLDGYIYSFNKTKGAIALGNGSLYNHSDKSNARHYFIGKKLYIEAKKNITPYEEVLINYGYTKADRVKYKLV